MNKLTLEHQKQFSSRLLFDPSVLDRIDRMVKVHEEAGGNPLSSAAACLNVIGSLSTDPKGLKKFLESFGLVIEELYEFPTGAELGGRVYQDRGYAIFEWVGPRKSPINEVGGGRGQRRTSVDAFVLARIGGKTTQLLIEWKFTEGQSRPLSLGRFCGGKGVERLKRYSSVVARMRSERTCPFAFSEEYEPKNADSTLGLHDLSPDHLYQLMRMTLLAKTTVGQKLGQYLLEDYRIVHLTHSANDMINVLRPEYLILSPGLQQYGGKKLHDAWNAILAPAERARFVSGYWDHAIPGIENGELREYLSDRYE